MAWQRPSQLHRYRKPARAALLRLRLRAAYNRWNLAGPGTGTRPDTRPKIRPGIGQVPLRFLAVTVAASLGMFTGVLLLPAGAIGQTLAAISAPASLSAIDAPVGTRFPCRVTGVHDGDGPIYCLMGPKVRLTAIAAREVDGSCRPGHPCPASSAESATAALRDLALGERLQCEKTGTSYGRVTAWCWRDDGTELNCAMVRSGHAAYWRRFDPDNRLCG